MDQFLKDSVEIEYGVGKFHQFENLRHLFVLVMSIFLVAINVLFKALMRKMATANWNDWLLIEIVGLMVWFGVW